LFGLKNNNKFEKKYSLIFKVRLFKLKKIINNMINVIDNLYIKNFIYYNFSCKKYYIIIY